ncbi:LysR family transcriptional regulator [Pseudomonas syringae]|nr:LysR family transcriptional regulator [Pseudomonas syringae]MBD8790276.1 LysR family transcriptional regulator [Pseudomonas syringae]MBD8799226.1 LysR family transcriptional regulator [Pseudomonas syringae]MBD8810052.1 LysR family transcriptional regulator [Pseudomonas syringae]
MDSLSGIAFFVQAAETRSFSEAARNLGVSASAVGKSVARLEHRLGVRLLHRSTRSITVTSEGALFLERCRRVLGELEAAELELSQTRQAPQGRLRVSVPLVERLVMPALTGFMHRYPAIELDLDFSDRLVDVIEEGFDVVVRTGEPHDSRLMSRVLGHFQMRLVATPAYLARHGTPFNPAQLVGHACLRHKFPSTGKLESWPLQPEPDQIPPWVPASMVCNTLEALLYGVLDDLGIACLPDFLVDALITEGRLASVLQAHLHFQGTFRLLWPSSKHLSPKLRVFIDHMVENLFQPDLMTSLPGQAIDNDSDYR